MDKNTVVVFLEKVNEEFNGTSKLDFLQGNFDFVKKQVVQNAGSVYGVFINITEEELANLPNEYRKDAYKYNDYYVLYWGKDVHPSNRISEHLKANVNTGSLHLNKRKVLHKYELIWGCIIVNNYDKFEQHLHEKYKPILGSNKVGKSLKNIKVIG